MNDDSSKALGLADEAALAPMGNAIPPQLAAEIEAARSYRARSKAANTVRAYDSDWRQFEEWCWTRDLERPPVGLRQHAARELRVVARDAAGGHVDQTGVAGHQFAERGIVPAVQPVGEQLGIRWRVRLHRLLE